MGEAGQDRGQAGETLTFEEERGVVAFAAHCGDSSEKVLGGRFRQWRDERSDLGGQGLSQVLARERSEVWRLAQVLGDAAGQAVGQPGDVDGLGPDQEF